MTIQESEQLTVKILSNLVHYKHKGSHERRDIEYLAEILRLLAVTIGTGIQK